MNDIQSLKHVQKYYIIDSETDIKQNISKIQYNTCRSIHSAGLHNLRTSPIPSVAFVLQYSRIFCSCCEERFLSLYSNHDSLPIVNPKSFNFFSWYNLTGESSNVRVHIE